MVQLKVLVNGRARIERALPPGRVEACIDLIRLKLDEMGFSPGDRVAVTVEGPDLVIHIRLISQA